MESTSSEETIRSVPPPEPPRFGAIDCASTVTHTLPSAIVSACGLPPTGIVAIGLLVLGLMRVTVPSPLLATHTDPAPNATPAGDRPTGIVAVTERVPGSIRTTASSSESTTHTPPAADRDPGRSVADGDRRRQPGRVHPDHVVGFGVGEPDRPIAERDPGRAGVRIDLVRGFSSHGVHARQQARRGCDPDRVALRRDRPRPARDDIADPHAAAEHVELGVDPADERARQVQIGLMLTRPPTQHRRSSRYQSESSPTGIVAQRAQRSLDRCARWSDRRGWPPTATPNRTRPRRVEHPPRPPP